MLIPTIDEPGYTDDGRPLGAPTGPGPQEEEPQRADGGDGEGAVEVGD